MKEIHNYGLIIEPVKSSDYFMGGGFIGTKEINPSGDWSGFLPEKELQNIRGIETSNCVAFSILSAIETLMKFNFQTEVNYSDRFLGLSAGTTSAGNSPIKVADAIRRVGLIPENELPFSDNIQNIDEYYSFKGADPTRCINLGKDWLTQYDFKYEHVFTGGTVAEKNALISLALKRSPVCISVAAWSVPRNGIHYKEWGDNHFTLCIFGETPTAWKIFDSYDNTEKLYSKESDIALALLYWITLKPPTEKTTFTNFISYIFNVINSFFKPDPVPMDKVEEISPDAPPIPVIKKSDISITLFAGAIQEFEGWVLPGQRGRDGIFYPSGSLSFRNKNPGNLKYVNNMYLAIGKDGRGFAKFATYADGFKALTTKIRNACEGKSSVYSPDMTILQFFQKYAPTNDGNYPLNYAKFVAGRLKCGIDLQIKYLLLE